MYKKDKEESWDTGTERELAKDCSYCSTVATVVISDEVLGVIEALCERIKEEWQLLLIGEDDGMSVTVTDYYVPEQEYGGAHVHNLDCIDKAFIDEHKVVAGIHSHADMQPYFSSVDEVTNNSLIKTHIVVNNKNKFVATRRIELPCGMKKFVDATVMRDLPVIPTVKKVKGIERMKKSAPVVYKSLFPASHPMGYGTMDALPGIRKSHAFDY